MRKSLLEQSRCQENHKSLRDGVTPIDGQILTNAAGQREGISR